MFDRCSQILEDLEEVDAAMVMRRGKPTGTLRLSAPLSFGQRHILPILDIYLKKWPEIRAEVSFSDRFVDLIEEGFDFAIRIPAYLLGEDLRSGKLIPELEELPFPPEPIRLIYPSKRHLSPHIRAFIDLLVESWEQGLPWE